MKTTLLLLAVVTSAAFADELTWTLTSGKTLRLDESSDKQKLVESSGATVAEFPVGEDVHGAVLSEGRTCLLVLVFAERLAERSANRRGEKICA
jgi:hypothetical protein